MKRENEHKEYCEQDILDQISRMSEDTEVPDSLRSENIDKLLEKKKQKKHFRPYQIGLVAAACVAVVVGTVVWQYGRMHEGAINSPDVSGGNAGSSAGNSNTVKKISDSKKIKTAQSYDEIYKYIKRSQDNSGIAMYARSVNETGFNRKINGVFKGNSLGRYRCGNSRWQLFTDQCTTVRCR